ncbi:MAG: DUF1214 domain-containing protein [Rhodoferax sp.]
MNAPTHWSVRTKRIAIGFLLYLGAVTVGVGSALAVLKKAPWLNPSVEAGVWHTNLQAGSQDAGMYTRATIAVNALLALGREETMYFVATRDDAGQTLRSQCNYRISGVPPQARWWSITAYAEDLFLFDAPNAHYSLNGSTAQLDASGAFALTTGPSEQAGTYWLPTPGQRPVVLTLRLYNPDPALQAAPQSLHAPSVQKIGDCA